jgi:hypothetical protein
MTYSWSHEALKQGLTAMKHSELSPPRYFLLFHPLMIFFKKIRAIKEKQPDKHFFTQRYVLKSRYCWEQRMSATSCSILIRFSTPGVPRPSPLPCPHHHLRHHPRRLLLLPLPLPSLCEWSDVEFRSWKTTSFHSPWIHLSLEELDLYI